MTTYMFPSSNTKNESGGIILNSLQPVGESGRETVENCVAVVLMGDDNGVNQLFGGGSVKVMTYLAYTVEVEAGNTTDTTNMRCKSEFAVNCNSEVLA